jgi:hypothetical protein
MKLFRVETSTMKEDDGLVMWLFDRLDDNW